MTHYLQAAPNSGCLRILITTPPLPQTRLTCYVGLAIIVAKRCITLEQGCFKLASTGVGIKWTGRRISWRLMWSSWILPPQKLIELIFVFYEVSIDLEEAIGHLSNGNGQRNCSTMLHKCPPIQKHLKTFPSKRSLKKKICLQWRDLARIPSDGRDHPVLGPTSLWWKKNTILMSKDKCAAHCKGFSEKQYRATQNNKKTSIMWSRPVR